MTLVELLIAMVVMALGISALVAGFSSGLLSVNGARLTSTVGTLADKQMEVYRLAGFASPSLAPRLMTGSTQTGSDGRTYWVGSSVSWTCVVGPANTTTSAAPPACSGTPPSRAVKLVSVEVHKGATSSDPVVFRQSATFDSSTS